MTRELVRDGLALAGVGLASYGLWWLHPALVFIGLGGALVGVAAVFLRGRS